MLTIFYEGQVITYNDSTFKFPPRTRKAVKGLFETVKQTSLMMPPLELDVAYAFSRAGFQIERE